MARSHLIAAREAVQELLWPTRCVGCDDPGSVLCADCAAKLPWIDQRWACPRCGAPFGHLVCTECRGRWDGDACVSALLHRGTAARLVRTYKDGHEARLAPVLAAAIATAVDEAASWPGRPELAGAGRPLGPDEPPPLPHLSPLDLGAVDALVFVPATAEAYRRRGFDHMELVARHLAPMLGLALADVLIHNRAADQRGLGREGRAANARGSFEVLGNVAGANLLLVDDVLTTGASIQAAREALVARGAGHVWTATATRVW